MEDTTPERDDTLNFGPQPLDALMTELGIGNHALVAASTDQLTHKQVQKARKGRRLSPKLQRKVAAAFKAAIAGRPHPGGESRDYAVGDLFNYHG